MSFQHASNYLPSGCVCITGLLFSKLMQFSYRKGLMDQESYIAQYLALAIFTTGVAYSLGADDLLAAFSAGNAVGTFDVD